MNKVLVSFTSAIMAMMICSCNSKWKSGSYEVFRLDTDLILGLNLDNGSSIGRVMHKVSAVGEDDTWIVVERYPQGDESITEYYYFEKADDHPHKNSDEIVLGPFTKLEFDKLKRNLNLPDCTKRF